MLSVDGSWSLFHNGDNKTRLRLWRILSRGVWGGGGLTGVMINIAPFGALYDLRLV